MDNCKLKLVFIVASVILFLVGLYLAFTREKKEQASGTSTSNTGEFDPKKGTVKVSGGIGFMLIIVGLAGLFVTLKYLPECDDSQKIERKDSVVKKQKTYVEGWVKDGESRNYVPGATVSLLGREETGLTGPDGHFMFYLNEEVEDVSVIIKADGYKVNPPILKKTNSVADYIISKQ